MLFPSFSAIQNDRKRLLGAYLSAVGMTSAVILPLNAGMPVAGREIGLVLIGDQSVGAIDVLPLLLLSSTFALVGNSAGVVAKAQAASNAKMIIALGSAVVLGGLLLWAEDGPSAGYGAGGELHPVPPRLPVHPHPDVLPAGVPASVFGEGGP